MSLFDECLDFFIRVVKEEKDANAAREEIYYILSSNRWKNPDLDDAVDLVVDLAEYYMDAYNARQAEAISDAAVKVATGIAAELVCTDKRLYREVDARIAQQSVDTSRTFKNLMRDVQSYRRDDDRGRRNPPREQVVDDRPRVRVREHDRRPPTRRGVDRLDRNPVRPSRRMPEPTPEPVITPRAVQHVTPAPTVPTIKQQVVGNRPSKPTLSVPHPQVFNTQTMVALWVPENNAWAEDHIPREENMQYDQHETDRFLKSQNPLDRRHRARGEMFTDALRIANQKETFAKAVNELTGTPADAETFEYVMEKTHVRIEEPLSFTMVDDYHTEVMDYIAQNKLPIDPESCVISYTCVSVLPWGLTEETLVALVERFKESKTWTDVKTIMGLLAVELSEHYWRKLNSMLTDQINEGLFVLTGTNNNIDNFTSDIGELLTGIAEDFGVSGVTALDSMLPWVVETTLKTFVTRAADGTEIYAFNQTYDITLLPVHSKDIDLGVVGKLGAVCSSQFPFLYRYIDQRFRAIGNTARYVRVVTSDGAALAVYKGFFPSMYFIGRV